MGIFSRTIPISRNFRGFLFFWNFFCHIWILLLIW
jgi:hypothetical protein